MALTETDYFADAAEILNLLHVGTSADSTEFSEGALDDVLAIIQGEVHDFLIQKQLISAAPVASTTTGHFTVKRVLVELLEQWNARRQHNKLNNQDGNPQAYQCRLDDQMKYDLFDAFWETEEDSIDVVPMGRHQYHEVL